MNTYPGVLGKKLGMTQVWNEDGTVTPCTVVESRSVVVGKRTRAKDGYDALVVGIGDVPEKQVSKPALGYFKKMNVAPRRTIRELRCSAEFAAEHEVGQELALDRIFEAGQLVDVQGVSRGKGFQGVMKRHHFAGSKSSHGAHEYQRHGGSIGMNMTPGHTLKGKRMGGQMGNVTRSVISQRIVKVITDEHLLLIKGGVPGAPNGTVVVRGAVKKRGGKRAS